MKKYELTTNTKVFDGKTLYQIRALASFGMVHAGDFGGYIEREENLSHDGNAWVSDNAQVSGDTDYLTIGPIGSRGDTTTFYRSRDGGTMVVCGCYHDTIDAFEARVKEVHHGTSHEAAYLAAVACARARVRTKPEEEA